MLLTVGDGGSGIVAILHHARGPHEGKAQPQWTAHSRAQGPLTKPAKGEGGIVTALQKSQRYGVAESLYSATGDKRSGGLKITLSRLMGSR